MDAIKYRRLTLALTAMMFAAAAYTQTAMNMQTMHYTCTLNNLPTYVILTSNGDTITGTISYDGYRHTIGGKKIVDHLIIYEYDSVSIVSKFEGKSSDRTLKLTRRMTSDPNKPRTVTMKQSGSQIRQLLRRTSAILKGDDKRNLNFTTIPILTQLKDLDQSERINALLESLVDGRRYEIPYIDDKVLALRTYSSDGGVDLRMLHLKEAAELTLGDCLTKSGIAKLNKILKAHTAGCDMTYDAASTHTNFSITPNELSIRPDDCAAVITLTNESLGGIRPYFRAVVSGLRQFR